MSRPQRSLSNFKLIGMNVAADNTPRAKIVGWQSDGLAVLRVECPAPGDREALLGIVEQGGYEGPTETDRIRRAYIAVARMHEAEAHEKLAGAGLTSETLLAR